MRERARIHVVDAEPLRYLVAVPNLPRTETGILPVLCFLHGNDEAAPLDIREAAERFGPLRDDAYWRAGEDFVVVVPQLPQAGDHWHRYADAVRTCVSEVQDRYGTDPIRRYLTGFSYGGNGVFDLGLAQPDFWAALWAVDPTRVPQQDPQQAVWLSIGAAARRQSERFVSCLGLEPGNPMASGRRLYLDEGRDHTETAVLAYRTAKIYDWLLDQHLRAS